MKKSLGAKTLVYPAPVLIIGSYSENDEPNVMAASWGGICCSEPPCVAVSLRTSRKTYDNIMKHKAFTVNIPSETYAKEADYFGIASGKNIDKFKVTGLTAVQSDRVHAPMVAEFPVVLACRLLQTIELGTHTQFVGEVVDALAEETVLNAAGHPDMEKVKPLMYGPDQNMNYFGVRGVVGRAFSMGRMFMNRTDSTQ